MRRIPLICAAVALVIPQGDARADPVARGAALAALGIVILAETLDVAPSREDRDFHVLQGGRFDPLQHESAAAEFGPEYGLGRYVLWKLKPFVGAGATT